MNIEAQNPYAIENEMVCDKQEPGNKLLEQVVEDQEVFLSEEHEDIFLDENQEISPIEKLKVSFEI